MLALIPYEVILTTHIVAFMFNFVMVFSADLLGLLWVLGKKETLPHKLMHRLHWAVWIGLSVSILSGALLFWDSKEYLLTVSAFYTKMILVGALVVNSFIIHKHLRLVTENSFKSLSQKHKISLFISGLVSVVCWVGVVVAAQFLGL